MPVLNLEEFTKALRKKANELPEKVVIPFQQKIALQILRDAVLNTRVDTGRARGGWLVGIETPNLLVSKRTDKTGKTALSLGERKILSVKKLTIIWIGNNVEYIGYLENGTDKMAPDNMLTNAVIRARSQF